MRRESGAQPGATKQRRVDAALRCDRWRAGQAAQAGKLTKAFSLA
jgi:hypothetical protein